MRSLRAAKTSGRSGHAGGRVALTSLAKLDGGLAGVRGRIGRTDALIDQVAYRLYGLTEEEGKKQSTSLSPKEDRFL